MAKRKKALLLDSTKVSFICKFCQRVYYQVDIKDFESDRKGTERAAKEKYQCYHNCPIKRKIAERYNKGGK